MHEFAIEPERSNAISVHLNPEWAGFLELYGNAFKVIVWQTSSTAKEIASNIWQINKEDKNPNIPQKIVGTLEATTFKGKSGYKFSVTSSIITNKFGDIITGFLIDRENIVLIVGNEILYGIIYPSKSSLADQILSTFLFIE